MKSRIFCLALVFVVMGVSVNAQNADIFKGKNIKAKMLTVAEWQLKNPNHSLTDERSFLRRRIRRL
jgi:hypothetical protein